jgi:hypothetical protein
MSGFTWTVSMDGTDIKDIVLEDGSKVDYGRGSLFEQPAPPYAILNLPTRDSYPGTIDMFPEFGLGNHSMPSGFVDVYADVYAGPQSRITLGAPVQVNARTESGFTDEYDDAYAGISLTRFTGYIQAIDYKWDLISLTCLPDMEAWGRITVGGTDGTTTIPAESDVDRVQRLCTQAGVTIGIQGPDGPQITAIPPSTAASDLLTQLTKIATDTGGLLFTDRDGLVYYRTSGWTPPATTTIPAGATVRDSLSMNLELGLVRNQITVEYGDATPRETVTATDTASITAYGLREASYQTQIDLEADAQDYADWLLASLDAAWQLPDVTVLFTLAADTEISAMAALEQGSPVTLPTLLAGSPESSYSSTVLGYTENLSRSNWFITYHLAPSNAPLPGVSA